MAEKNPSNIHRKYNGSNTGKSLTENKNVFKNPDKYLVFIANTNSNIFSRKNLLIAKNTKVKISEKIIEISQKSRYLIHSCNDDTHSIRKRRKMVYSFILF